MDPRDELEGDALEVSEPDSRPRRNRHGAPVAQAPPGLPRSTMLVVGLLACVSLVCGFGFHLDERTTLWLERFDIVIAGIFAVDLGICFFRTESKQAALRQRWYEYVLLAFFALSLGLVSWISGGEEVERFLGALHMPSMAKLYLAVIEAYIVINLLIRFLRSQERFLAAALRPELLLITSFAGLVLIGAAILLLPRATAAGRLPLSPVDALFTATSAVCVTGLAVRDTGADLSLLGQLDVLFLIQIGGFGIITFVAMGSILSARRFSVPQMVALREIFSARTLSDVRRHVLSLVAAMLLIEGIGTLLLLLALPDAKGTLLQRTYWSAFHAVSAFCNAGFGLESTSLQAYRGSLGINLTVMGLIVLGGLGAPVLRELASFRVTTTPFFRGWRFFRRVHVGRIPSRLSLQAKLSLRVTFFLLVLGFVGFWLLERGNALRDEPLGRSVLASAFNAVTPRTAGFDTVPIGTLRDATLLLLMFLMVIGAGPVSTGGGVKTVTFGVLLHTLRAMMVGHESVEAHGRSIPRRVVRTAISVFVLYLTAALLVTFALSLTDSELPFLARAFESVSALSTVGLSTGITPQLSAPGKLVLCLAMFAGRVGPLSLAISIFRSRRREVAYAFPEEELVVG